MLNKLFRLLVLLAWLALLCITPAVWWLYPVQPRLSWPAPCAVLHDLHCSADGRTIAGIGGPRPAPDMGMLPGPMPSDDANFDVVVWDAGTGAVVARRSVICAAVPMVQLRVWPSPDGRTVGYLTSRSPPLYEVWLWHPDDEPRVLSEVQEVLAFTSDSRYVSARNPYAIIVFETRTGKEQPLPFKHYSHRYTERSFAATTDGRLLVANHLVHDEGESLIIWDLVSRTKVATLPTAMPPVVFSEKGQFLAARVLGGVKVWQLPRVTEHAALPSPDEGWAPLPQKLSDDGRLLIAQSEPSQPLTGIPLAAWDLSIAPLKKLAEGNLLDCSGDGRWLLIGKEGRVLDTLNGTERTLHLPGDYMQSSFAPHGPMITCGWLSSGMPSPSPWWEPWLGWFRISRPQPVRTSPYSCSVFDCTTGQELLSINGCSAWQWSPDGQTLVVAQGSLIQVWEMPPRRPWWVAFGLPSGFASLLLAGYWFARRIRFTRTRPAFLAANSAQVAPNGADLTGKSPTL